MVFQELETDRLLLKNISSDDREFIYRQFSDDEVTKYLFDEEPLIDINGADEIIELYLRQEPRLQHRWILVRKTDGVKMGTCGFHCWDKTKDCCDVGYDLFPAFWGKGYMNEAMREILKFARTDMGVKYIHACIFPDNQASVRLAEKHGFAFLGKMKDEIFRGQKYPHRIFTLDCSAI